MQYMMHCTLHNKTLESMNLALERLNFILYKNKDACIELGHQI